MDITGDLGQIRVGYQVAATIRKWSAGGDSDTLGQSGLGRLVVTAKVEGIDLYWSRLPPTSLRLWMGEFWWVWNCIEVQLPVVIGQVEVVVMGIPTVIK